MVIEIHRPELEALITDRLLNGPFQTITDLLWDALKSAPVEKEPPRPQPKNVIEFFRKSPQRNKGTDSNIEWE